MKKSLFLFVASIATLLSFTSIAQTNTFPSSGNVGIGTTSPSATLFVSAGSQTTGDDAVIFDKPHSATSAAFRYTFTNVGGLSTDPLEPFWKGFHITSPSITVNGSNSYPRIVFYAEYNSFTDPSLRKWVIRAGDSPLAHDIQFMSETTNLLYLKSDGKVGIGTTSPSEKLSVNGNILSKKVRVTQSGWADYVFHRGYKLPSLTEVEVYIKQHQHLPDIPSAKEVEKNGIDLGDNQAALLRKIEELTLYMIEMKKENEQMKKEIKSLQKRINH